MKKGLIYFIVLSAVILTDCTSREESARRTAEDFLTSYYGADFSSARDYCTASFAALLDTAVSGFNDLPELIRANMAASAEKTECRITSIDAESFEDRIIVEFEISSEELTGTLKKKLLLAEEDGEFLVDSID